ncbi:unnamed protein product [Caenorhabditis bovis]|uniref:Alpha-galactosidase n=1 Tax=Caenorhabditis bovis TaxID=2654633 RepID=A0A8S1E891_9PELO|nr:unnamed protein product [Caenorhabditis bovis]
MLYADFIAGWAAGGAGLIVGHPLDTVKARLQTMTVYKGILDCMTQTMRQESIYGLYKGMLIPFISTGAIHSLLFAGYGAALKFLHPGESNIEARKDLPMSEILFASICGTMVQVGPVIPVELVKTKLQVQRENISHFKKHAKNLYAGPMECIRDTVRSEGIRGLFKGGSVVLLRDNIGYLFYIPVYEGLLRSFRSQGYENTWTQLFSGGMAGISGWISVCPLEVVKNRIQAMKSHTKISPKEMTLKIYKEEGISAFYRGGWAISVRGFVVNSVDSTAMSTIIFLALLASAVYGLDNGLARTPPMGWMSWTAFYCEIDCVKHPNGCINEKLYMDMADRLVSDGYRELGYKSVHIDDCWSEMERDENGLLEANRTRFPSGMKKLAKYMHDRGLRFGIYEDYGTKTCGGYPGSYGHLKADAQTFASWDVDYLKLDGCYIDTDLMPEGYAEMGRELNATGRPIVYSCSWPAYLIDHPEKVDYNLIGKHCNTWRNFDDINSSWKSIQSIINYYDHNQDKHIPTHGPGKWHDPDMLVIGNKGITVDMAIAQMSIWCIWAAPLIMSNDLRIIAPEFREILLNQDAININQDPLGIMGRLVANTTDLGLYVKPIMPTSDTHSSFGIAVLNRNLSQGRTIRFTLKNIGLTYEHGYLIREIWTNTDFGLMSPNDEIEFNINPTSAALFRADIASMVDPRRWKKFKKDSPFRK